jgi:hypothetical protein
LKYRYLKGQNFEILKVKNSRFNKSRFRDLESRNWRILEVSGHLYIFIQSMPIAIKVCNLNSRDKMYSRCSFMWWSRIPHTCINKTNKYFSHQSSVNIIEHKRTMSVTCIILFLAPIVTFVVKIISNYAIFSLADVYFYISIRTEIFIFNIRIL